MNYVKLLLRLVRIDKKEKQSKVETVAPESSSYRKSFTMTKQFSTSSDQVGRMGSGGSTSHPEEKTSRSFHFIDQNWLIKQAPEDKTSTDTKERSKDFNSKILDLTFPELLLVKSALSFAKEESGFFIGPGQWLYDKVQKHIEVYEKTPKVLPLNNVEMLLMESALSIAIEEMRSLVGLELLYKKVRTHLEARGYRFNPDGTYSKE